MAYVRRTIKDRSADGDDVFILTELEGGRVRLTPDPNIVNEVGTMINADLLQPIEDAASVSVPQTRKVVVEGPGIQGGGTLSDDVLISSTPIPVVAGDDASALSHQLTGTATDGLSMAVSTRILPFIGGSLRVTFTARMTGTPQATSAQLQVYRGYTPVGTIHTATDVDIDLHFEEDISGWEQGDRLGIEVTVNNGTVTLSDVDARFEFLP